MTIQRRKLAFNNLIDAVHDAEHLMAAGYQRKGKWDLAQCCHHLAVLMEYPIDGFPKFSFPLNVGTWILRHTVAPGMLKKVLQTGVWPAGTPTDQRTVSSSGGDDAKAVAELSTAVDRLLHHGGPFQTSPLFGLLDKKSLIELHRIHTAHHLSYLVPLAPRSKRTS